MPIENYFYHGFLYTWHHEPENLYSERHISIVDCVHVINEDLNPTEQDWFSPSRWKFVGNGRHRGANSGKTVHSFRSIGSLISLETVQRHGTAS